MSNSDERSAIVEKIEVDAWAEIQSRLDTPFRERLGVEVRRVGDGLMLSARHVDMLAMNRVFGMGLTTAVTEGFVDDTIGAYRAAGVCRFVLQLAPGAATPALAEILAQRGFRALPRMAKFCRAVKSATWPKSDLRIIEVSREGASLFGTTAAAAHGLAETMAPGFTSTIGLSGWRHYLAMDKWRPVAVAALFTRGEVAWCGFGGTLESDRGRGAHSALLMRRIRDAASARCRWIVAETTEETPERPNASYRNMQRAGFDLVHLRATYLLDLRSADVTR